jgi:hypothetical protein
MILVRKSGGVEKVRALLSCGQEGHDPIYFGHICALCFPEETEVREELMEDAGDSKAGDENREESEDEQWKNDEAENRGERAGTGSPPPPALPNFDIKQEDAS